MPEYLAPGVYVEETSFRSKSIEGVGTTTTGLLGPARSGPVGVASDVITSLAEYERVYGDGQSLGWSEGAPNYLWHAARAFFDNGGRRLYVVRTWRAPDGGDGIARTSSGAQPSIQARFPGQAGNVRVRLERKIGKNAAIWNAGIGLWLLSGVSPGDVVYANGGYAVAVQGPPTDAGLRTWGLRAVDGDAEVGLSGGADAGHVVLPVKLRLSVLASDGGLLAVRDGLNPNTLASTLGQTPASPADLTQLPIVVLSAPLSSIFRDIKDVAPLEVTLRGGSDGLAPGAPEYKGHGAATDEEVSTKTGLYALEDLEDVSIVAAPGASVLADYNAIAADLLVHCQRMRYRIGVLDSVLGQTIGAVRAWRARYDSSHGALYYPWVRVLDPATRREVLVPPSGFIAGIYARNDNSRSVYKAPANEVVNLALGFELTLNQAQQEVLNPEGINCLRFFEGRGLRVWGARTLSSDPEWKYVNVRRYFAYLERSIDRGTQWAVFEPNGPALWNNVKRTIEDFLLAEFQSGALLGDRPEKAYFVRCDRSTMTQNDLDNGRMICLIGVAPLKPAEFVIFRIGQWTADAKN